MPLELSSNFPPGETCRKKPQAVGHHQGLPGAFGAELSGSRLPSGAGEPRVPRSAAPGENVKGGICSKHPAFLECALKRLDFNIGLQWDLKSLG